MPITGTAGIECRTPDTGNAYQLIFTFGQNITDAGSATKQAGNATVGTATIGPLPTQVTVPLTNVANAQHVLVNLNNVHDCHRRDLLQYDRAHGYSFSATSTEVPGLIPAMSLW